MRNAGFIWIVASIMAAIDLYVFQVVKMLCSASSQKTKTIIFTAYWALSIAIIILFILLPLLNTDRWPKNFRNYLFVTIIAFFFAKVLASVFFLVDDLRRLIQWAVAKIFFRNTEGESQVNEGISRSVFLSWLGIGVGSTLITSLLYGFSNKYNYQIRRIPLSFGNLPSSFRGLKIVQISDIHSGSFDNRKAVEKGVRKIMD
ncbi:MAG TPA: metallophosphoesterase, partial [Puia sp.]